MSPIREFTAEDHRGAGTAPPELSQGIATASGTATQGGVSPDDAIMADIDAQIRKQNDYAEKLKELQAAKDRVRALERDLAAEGRLDSIAEEPQDDNQERTVYLEEDEETPPPKRQQVAEFTPVGRGPKAKEPDRYKGKNQKDLEAFLRACKNYIRVEYRRYPNDASKVYWAVTYLDDDPAEAWERYEKDTSATNHGDFT